MKSEVIAIETGDRRVIDLTKQVESFAAGCEGDGLIHIFAPHATAGLALMETGSGSEIDLEAALETLLPRVDKYAHRHGSPGHGADHLLPALVSPSLLVPLVDGGLALGTWQSVVLVDMNRDNPHRNIRLSFARG